MSPEQTPISRAISDVLTGYYSRRRLTQDLVAERAEMSIFTLQKKLKGKAPITATDLVVLSAAIGVEPETVLAEAMKEVAAMSDAPPTIEAHVARKRAAAADLTGKDVDERGQPHAANVDPEHERDDPDAP